jgi:hypothetical protein
MTRTFAVVPDIHADQNRLDTSLACAGSAPLAFLGDFIDSMSAEQADDAAVLQSVRSLIDERGARAVMGNHELNAILFHTTGPDGQPLRPHLPRNIDQHASFIARFGVGTDEARHWCDWFLTLPLWLDLDGVRLVHACWDAQAIATISARRPDGRLRPEDLEEVAAKTSDFAKAVEQLTSGPEVRLPEGHSFHDRKGVERHHVRLSWWRLAGGTWRDASLAVPNPKELPVGEITNADGLPVYAASEPPVFCGHYKMKGPPRIEAPQAACLDYPETPCIYLWQGETALHKQNLLVV